MTIQQTKLVRTLRCKYPIIQAPIGGVSTIDLTVVTIEAGGFGFIAAAYLTPEQIIVANQEIHTKTDKPFGINLFAPIPAPQIPDTYEDSSGILSQYPYQNAMTRGMRRVAAKQGNNEYLSSWAGQGLSLSQSQSTAELMSQLISEMETSIRRFSPKML